MEEKERKPFRRRLRGLTAVVFLVFGILIFNLWHLQIAEGSYYAAMARGNVMRLVPLPATRGDIVDRSGELLATSVPEFALTLDWLDLQKSMSADWKDVILRLAGFVKPYWPNQAESVQNIEEDILVMIQDHQWVRYRPMTILQNVPKTLRATVAEHQEELPGVSVDAVPVRYYPQHTLAGQVLGYVRQISKGEISQFDENPDAKKAGFRYQPGDMVGKMGVEKAYDFWLRGVEGEEQVEVDNNARPVAKTVLKQPQPGKTIHLTLDAKLQSVVENSLEQIIKGLQRQNPNAKAGAAVVIDVNTGQILAMASEPAMDPNALIGNISAATAYKYFQDKDAASFNRALTGLYAPGSTFKMITALAALKAGVVTPTETINDVKSSLGSASAQAQGFSEWGGNYFGQVDLYKAIAMSSDIYFQVVGARVFKANPGLVKQLANEAGLGEYSGVDLPGEAKGIAPSPAWKKAYYEPYYKKLLQEKLAAIETKYGAEISKATDAKQKAKLQQEEAVQKNDANVWYNQMVAQNVDWHLYDSFNNAIGQGYNYYTPLQLANYVATIVNGGKHYQPYIVNEITDPVTGKVIRQYQPKLLNTLDVSQKDLDIVKKAMSDTTAYGTGAIFGDVPGFSGGAKTGTAQLGSKNTLAAQTYNGTFVAFAPYNHPQIAFAGVVEYANHGVDSAGMVCKAAFKAYFGWK
ncbi:Penicillin binding protein transpeptidase domain [Acididesulfobacillus acetoxydans]|uniref:Penicillin binding protein transpeptidase domain n=1 Tax=Acididesulfobacillus acetoxydans TaxID=1561005 RepID=A0A8S0Y1E3_9FIRM|nr:penicillin-binding protein 2 [Acididesulfobacillus acetoxydans]CAA7599435.1 Penicillin binding protein transpeptidase domain [Acididesulfobacillus acetoxydans]CEJ06760.1 Penicillin-binding protein 2 [Acididesulfobacillus acetoxydans]